MTDVRCFNTDCKHCVDLECSCTFIVIEALGLSSLDRNENSLLYEVGCIQYEKRED